MITLVVATALLPFNLVCTGLETEGTPQPGSFTGGLKQSQFTETYRVDLDQGRWCKDACTKTLPLAEVTNRRLAFLSGKLPGDSGFESSFADREDGAFRHTLKIGAWMSIREGVCQKASFTGFPALKF